ncbi:hypothetical protein OQA88_760 [Cercophora sp. LCS_1]
MSADVPFCWNLSPDIDQITPPLSLRSSSTYGISDSRIAWIRGAVRLAQSGIIQSGAAVSKQDASRIRLPFETCSQAARAAALAFLATAASQNSRQWPNVLTSALAFLLGLGRLLSGAKWRRIALRQLNILLVATLAVLLASDLLPLLEVGHNLQLDRPVAGALGSLTAAALIAFVTPREWLPPTLVNKTPFTLPEAKPSPEETCSWFASIISFHWISPLVWKGWRSAVEISDLPSLPWYDEPLWILSNLIKARAKYKKSLWTIVRFQRAEILTMAAWIALDFSSELVGPFATYRLLEYIAAPNEATLHPSIWIFLLFAGPMTRTVAFQQYVFTSTRLIVRIRSGITQELYHKAMSSLEPEDDAINQAATAADAGKRQSATTKAGRMANLMASDTDAIVRARDIVRVGVGVPTGMVITVIGLYRIVGWPSFVGISFLFLTAPLPTWLAGKMNHVQRRIKLAQDSRISLISEYLRSIKAIKYFAWEDPVAERVHQARAKELKDLWHWVVLNVLVGQFAALIPVITLLTIFGLYVGVLKQPLTASVAFTTSTLTLMLKRNLTLVAFISRNVVAALVSLERLDRYFASTEPLMQFPVGPLRIQAATFRRSRKETSFRLRDISIDFIDGGLNVVSGKSGSGKTSLLLSILGELALERGAVTRPSDVAFASQTPWLQNKTIRDNIVFNSPFEKAQYDRIIEACCLSLDLDELASGDQTEVGEDGAVLSGGQKSRIALARALYSKAPLLLIDDVFAALDTKTALAVWSLCFCSDLLHGRTVVLVTQVPWLAPQADLSITMEDGMVKAIEQNLGVIRKPAQPEPAQDMEESSGGDAIEPRLDANAKQLQPADTRNDIASEMKASGGVARFMIFRYMLYFGGVLHLSVALFLTVLVNTLGLATTYWLSIWVDAYESSENINVAFYAGIYALIMNTLSAAEGIALAVYQRGGWVAGRRLHAAMTRAVLGAPLSWWKNVPIGRVINRFSQDIRSMDLALGEMVSSTLDMVVRIFFQVGAVSSILPIFMVPVLGTVSIGVVFGEMYTRTAVTVRRLLSSSRSPVFSHFGETMDGLAVIRARNGMPETFCHQLAEKIRPYAKAEEATYNLNRWVAIRIDFITALVMMSAGIIAVWKADVLKAGQVGFSLSSATRLSYVILSLVRNMNDLEVELQSFHRVEEYVKLEPEERIADAKHELDDRVHDAGGDSNLSNDWPQEGSIELRNVTIRWDPEGPDILKDINLTFAPGRRIAVVGRTGSGKSTLISSLLRFTHIVSGQILFDGVDITRITRKRLRQAVTIIPQDAALFNGTVQTNLDPSGTVPVDVLEKTLQSCSGIASFRYSRSDEDESDTQANANGEDGRPTTIITTTSDTTERTPLLSHAEGLRNGTISTLNPTTTTTTAGRLSLTTKVQPNGENFSHGQRQLISLCRALIRRSKLMLLDEATANMDYETDAGVQAVLRKELRGDANGGVGARTLVTIAHRLRTIIDYDQVVVMGGGRVLEIGTPRELYARGGQFTELVKHSGEGAELVDMLEGNADVATL